MPYRQFGLFEWGLRGTALRIIRIVAIKSGIAENIEIFNGISHVNNLSAALREINYAIYKDLSEADKATFRESVAEQIYQRSVRLPNPLSTEVGRLVRDKSILNIDFNRSGLGYNRIPSDSEKIAFPEGLMETDLLKSDIKYVVSQLKDFKLTAQPRQTSCTIL